MDDKPEEKISIQGKILFFEKFSDTDLAFYIRDKRPGWERARDILIAKTYAIVKSFVRWKHTDDDKGQKVEIIEDETQGIMSIIFRKYEEKKGPVSLFEGKSTWKTYVTRISIHYINSEINKKKNRYNIQIKSDQEQISRIIQSINYKDKLFDLVYSKIETERLMKHLDEEHKKIVQLHFFYGWQKNEIAKYFGHTPPWVNQQMNIIREIARNLNSSDQPGETT